MAGQDTQVDFDIGVLAERVRVGTVAPGPIDGSRPDGPDSDSERVVSEAQAAITRVPGRGSRLW